MIYLHCVNILVVESGFRIEVNSGALLSVALKLAPVNRFKVSCLPVAATLLVAVVKHSDLLIVFTLRAWTARKPLSRRTLPCV